MVQISDGAFFRVCTILTYFCSSTKICMKMTEMSSEQWISQFICIQSAVAAAASTLCVAILLLTVVAAAAVLLLPAAVRHRVPDGQICCWFIESDASVFFLFIQERFSFDGTPRPYCVAFTASMLGNYGIRACAEPRRASARRGEPPLVCKYTYFPFIFHLCG